MRAGEERSTHLCGGARQDRGDTGAHWAFAAAQLPIAAHDRRRGHAHPRHITNGIERSWGESADLDTEICSALWAAHLCTPQIICALRSSCACPTQRLVEHQCGRSGEVEALGAPNHGDARHVAACASE